MEVTIKEKYNSKEKIEKYFLDEYVSGDLLEREYFKATIFRDKELFLAEVLEALQEAVGTEEERLRIAFNHGIANALVRKLQEM